MKKYITCSVPLEKKVRKISKNRKKKSISYRLKCIDRTRFMASSLSNLVNNLAEGIDKIKM